MVIKFSLVLIIGLLICLWGILGGYLYRKPVYLIALGVGISLLGGFISGGFGYLSSVDVHIPSIRQDEYYIAAQLVGFAFASVGGGIISSGILIHVQRLAERDKKMALWELQRTQKQLESVNAKFREMNAIKDEDKSEDFLKYEEEVSKRCIQLEFEITGKEERVKKMDF